MTPYGICASSSRAQRFTFRDNLAQLGPSSSEPVLFDFTLLLV